MYSFNRVKIKFESGCSSTTKEVQQLQGKELVERELYVTLRHSYLFDLFDWWHELFCILYFGTVMQASMSLHSSLNLCDHDYCVLGISLSNYALHI